MDPGEIPLGLVYSNTEMTGVPEVLGGACHLNRNPNNPKKSHDPDFHSHSPPGRLQNARRI